MTIPKPPMKKLATVTHQVLTHQVLTLIHQTLSCQTLTRIGQPLSRVLKMIFSTTMSAQHWHPSATTTPVGNRKTQLRLSSPK